MNWSKGFSARYRLTKVDPMTWGDIEKLDFTSGSITRSADGLMQGADLEVTQLLSGYESWIRVYLDARQEGESDQTVALFTGLASISSRNIDGLRNTYPLDCYSVLKPVSDVLLDRGWYAPKGGVVSDIVSDLLSVTPAPVESAEGSPALSSYVIAEEGETRLSMAQYLLSLIDWEMRVTGDGRIIIAPTPNYISARFNSLDNDIVGLTGTDTMDWFDCPNVIRVVSGDTSLTIKDDDENSMLSTVSRGREIWMEETVNSINDNETLEQYARRRLAEEQQIIRSFSYTRRYFPEIFPGDLVDITYPQADFNGVFKVTDQTLTLGYSIEVSESGVLVG